MPRFLVIALELLLLLGVVACLALALVQSLKRSEDPARLVFKWFLTLAATGGLLGYAYWIGPSVAGAFIVPFACIGYGVLISILWAPQIGHFFAKPLTGIFDGGDEEIEPQPLYSAAQSKINRGHYQQAAFAIKEQLAKFPTDYYGQTLLAKLQVEHLNDLPGAQVTIERLAAQPGHPPKSIAAALSQLAEWHLKYAQDIEAARQTFEKIIGQFPNTEEAHVASQHLAHLGTTEDLLKVHDRPTIAVRPGVRNLGLLKATAAPQKPVQDPAAQAAEYVRHLEEFPQDAEAREKLAWLYAEHYGRVDLAVDQVEQLVQQPNQPVRQKIHWLDTIANLHIRFSKDEQLARNALERIIELNPNAPAAKTARLRLDHLALELRSHAPAHVVRLGEYEQNIGLKKGPPRPSD